jgi:hypothetical protein
MDGWTLVSDDMNDDDASDTLSNFPFYFNSFSFNA